MALGAPHAYSEEAAEARNPALHNSAHYYQGSVEQAIADARAKNSFLVIFLKGGERESYIADETLHVSLGWKPLNCIALRLHDDLLNGDPEAFPKAKAFRQIFPSIGTLPFLMVLSPEGRPIASLQSTDVAKLAPYVLQKTASEYPFREPGAADSDFEMSGDLQKQQSFDPLQVPSSPDVSEASSATSRINSSLGIGTGAPSQFPHSNVQALGHALLVVGQQAAQSAAVGATPSARFNATAGATANPPSFTSGARNFLAPPMLPGTRAPSSAGNENSLAIAPQLGRAASPGLESSLHSEQSAAQLPEPSTNFPAASFADRDRHPHSAMEEVPAAARSLSADLSVSGEPQEGARVPEAMSQLSDVSGSLPADTSTASDAQLAEALPKESLQPSAHSSGMAVQPAIANAASPYSAFEFPEIPAEAALESEQPQANKLQHETALLDVSDRLSSNGMEAPEAEHTEAAPSALAEVEYQPLMEEEASEAAAYEQPSTPELSFLAADRASDRALPQNTPQQSDHRVHGLGLSPSQQSAGVPHAALQGVEGAAMPASGMALAARSEQPDAAGGFAPFPGFNHQMPESEQVPEETLPLLHPEAGETAQADSSGFNAPSEVQMAEDLPIAPDSAAQADPMAIEEPSFHEPLNASSDTMETAPVSSIDVGKSKTAEADMPEPPLSNVKEVSGVQSPLGGSRDTSSSLREQEPPAFGDGFGPSQMPRLPREDLQTDEGPTQEAAAAFDGPEHESAVVASPRKAYLAIRLTDGSFLRTDFSADAILFDVLHYIDEHRSDGHGPYLLRTPYPHRYLNTNNGSQTLTDLDLCPRSLLALQPVNAAPSTTSITGLSQRFVTAVSAWVTAVVALLAGFFFGLLRGTRPAIAERPQNSNSRLAPGAPRAFAQPEESQGSGYGATPFKGGTVSSKTSSGNSQLRKRKNGGNSEEGNVYYNGNSTEFKGNDDS